MPFTVESYAQGGKAAQKVEATRLLVRDQAGNPVFVAVEYAGGILCASLLDDDFATLLRTLGAEAAVVAKQIEV